MKRLSCLLIGSLLFALPAANAASKPVLPGAAPVGISLWAKRESKIGPNGEFQVVVSTWADGVDPGAIATGTIEVEAGAAVLGGDVARKVHPSAAWAGTYDRDWRITVRCPADGQFVLRASLRFTGPAGDVTQRVDCVESFRIASGVVRAEDARTVVAFGTVDGRRVRYGGRDLVAMDPDELELPNAIESPPAPLDEVRVECRGCTLPGPLDVPLLLTVGKSGKVTWVRRSTKGEAVALPGGVWAAIEREIDRHQFRPARAAGKPVADNLELRVRVISSN